MKKPRDFVKKSATFRFKKMEPKEIFTQLIEVYEKLGIEIRQLPSGSQDSPKSGMAKIRGKKVFFLQN